MSDEGWTIIQRRVNGDLDFNKGWADYKAGSEAGFETNYWMGLDNIYRLLIRDRKYWTLICIFIISFH